MSLSKVGSRYSLDELERLYEAELLDYQNHLVALDTQLLNDPLNAGLEISIDCTLSAISALKWCLEKVRVGK